MCQGEDLKVPSVNSEVPLISSIIKWDILSDSLFGMSLEQEDIAISKNIGPYSSNLKMIFKNL